MDKKRIIKTILIFAFFALAFYLVEIGPYSASSVADFNNDYGTFDMKSYDSQTVREMMPYFSPEGIHVYKIYYLMDFIFIAAFLILQCYLSLVFFKWCSLRYIKIIVCIIPVLRGVFDIIENAVLLRTLFSYPSVNDVMINFSSYCTQAKLLMIRLWLIEIAIGIILLIAVKIKEMVKKHG